MKTLRLFLWQAIDPHGQLREGELMSGKKNEVSQWLIEQGLQPCQINSGKRISPGQWRGEPLIQFSHPAAGRIAAGQRVTIAGGRAPVSCLALPAAGSE